MSGQKEAASEAGKSMDLLRLLQPSSIAIIGASTNPASMSARALLRLQEFSYSGDIHLVNPKKPIIDGIQCVASVDDLPMGVDAAIFSIPQAAVEEALEAGARRNLGSAVLFSAGYAEVGEEGREAQERLSNIARAGGIALAGPNCLGLVNYCDGVPLTSGPVKPVREERTSRLAILAQSGGMMGCLINASEARGLPLSYAISTGNEAVLGIEDYLEFVVEDKNTRAISIFVEQLRNPAQFLKLAARARTLGKPVILLHSGRSERAREASLSHTGAVMSNFAAMEVAVRAEGVILVEGMDELIDVAEICTLFNDYPQSGAGIITDSGAFKGLALDFAEQSSLRLPVLQDKTVKNLAQSLPEFVEPSNPLDLTAQAMLSIDTMYAKTTEAILEDPQIDCALVCVLPGATHIVIAKAKAIADAATKIAKPVICVFLGGGLPIPDEAKQALYSAGVPLFQSGERAITAMAAVLAYGEALNTPIMPLANSSSTSALPKGGILPEYLGKEYLSAAIGLNVPKGQLAKDLLGAVDIAKSLGFPVVMKVQHQDLLHKSDVGGVIVGLDNEAAVIEAWNSICSNVENVKPGLDIDGILVEKMGKQGVELVIGAKRDADWGPMVMIGLGGVWIELLEDVQLLPAGSTAAAFKTALLELKGAPLLTGYRGSQPTDIDAVCLLAERIGTLMLAVPEIQEIDINPVIAHPKGEGIEALDALVISHNN